MYATKLYYDYYAMTTQSKGIGYSNRLNNAVSTTDRFGYHAVVGSSLFFGIGFGVFLWTEDTIASTQYSV